MRRDEVIKHVNEKLDALGVGSHVRCVRRKPPKVLVQVFINKRLRQWELRSGITFVELESKLAELSTAWQLHQQGQGDIEDTLR